MYLVACVTSAFHVLVTRVTCSVENLQAKLSKASELCAWDTNNVI